MKSVIGALRVNLGLDSAQFNKGLKKANGGLSRFARGVATALAAAAAAAAAGMALLIKRSLAYIDVQAKTARSIDGSINALRALQIAAGDAGVDVKAVGNDMQSLSRELGRAALQGGVGKKALDALGLSADALANLDADDRVAMIADRVKELGLSSGQTMSILRDLGVRSKDMSLLLIQGGDAIRAARQEVDDLGLSLSAVDAEKVEIANDAMSRIGFATEALGNRLTVALAPALTAMANGFSASLREGGLLRTAIDALGSFLERLISNMGTVVEVVRYVVQGFSSWIASSSVLSSALTGLKSLFENLGILAVVRRVSDLIQNFQYLIDATGGVGEAMVAMSAVAIEVVGRVREGFALLGEAGSAAALHIQAAFASGFAAVLSAFASLTQAVATGLNNLFGSNLQGIGSGFADQLRAEADYMGEAAGAFSGSLASSFEALGAPLSSMDRLRGKIADGRDMANEAADAVDGLGDSLSSLDPSGAGGGGKGGSGPKKAKASLEKLKDTARDSAKSIEDSFTNTFTAVFTRSKSVSDALKDLLADLLQMSIRANLSSFFAGKLGGLGGLLFPNANGNAFAGGKVTAFANGGVVSGPTLFGMAGKQTGLMGEAGPEAIMPLTRIGGKLGVMATGSAGAEGGVVELIMRSDPAVIVEIARNEAGAEIKRASPGLVSQSVQATGRAMRATKSFGNSR